MRKYLLFIYLIFVSCSQTYLEETQDAVSINTRVSYDILNTGILLEWDTQWDFARVEISRGSEADKLSVFKENPAQNEWLDIESLPGQDYYYRIKTYNSKNRIIGQSDIIKGYRSYRPYDQVVVPSNLKTYFAKHTDKIEIFWVGDVQDVFRVYRSANLRDTPVEIAEISFNATEELKYNDTNIESGMTYFYTLSSVGKNTDATVSEKMTQEPLLEGSTKIAPKGAKANSIMSGIEVSWDDDTSSEYYQVYRSETEEGEYQLVVPFTIKAKHTDKNLPTIKGSTDAEGVYSYPLYYYKIKAFSSGQESGFSDPVSGFAIDPRDSLPAPASFVVELDKSIYPYELDFSWTAIEAVSRNVVSYRLSKIDGNGVTNTITTTTSLTYENMPNEGFNSQWEYIVQAINDNAGGLPGYAASKNYASSTPAPPIILTISTNARTYKTNELHIEDGYKFVETHIYWSKGGNQTTMTGVAEEEWLVTSKAGNIDLTWEKQIESEYVDYYTVYRRKQGDTDFKEVTKVTDVDQLIHSDKNFTKEEAKGSLVDGKFVYPFYEYQITATSGLDESAPSGILVGSAINQDDILPAPDYVTIPFHWADGKGFGQFNGGFLFPGDMPYLEGTLSPEGIKKIVPGTMKYNAMYLTWGKVEPATTYRVRYAQGTNKEEWWAAKDYNSSTANTFVYINNELKETALYVTGDYGGYVKNSASFDVGSVNGAAGNLLGDVRGIWFDEPDKAPAHY